MPNPPVLTQFAMPDPGASPLNLTQLFTLANTLVASEILGDSFNTYVIQSTTPSQEEQDKVWFEIDGSGRPKAIKLYYHGSWRRVYNGMLGEIRGFHGDPGYGDPPANFDENGLGNVGGEYDGWALCNGKNGTPDLSDKFIIGGHMNKEHGDPYDSGWKTWNGDALVKTGGKLEVTLTDATTYRPAKSGIRFRHWSADGNTPEPHTGNLYGVPANPPTNSDNDDLVAADPGNPTPDPIKIAPPFIAMGWIIFKGYA